MRTSRKILGLMFCFCLLIGQNLFGSYDEDSIKVEKLNQRAWDNRRLQNDSANIYARKAIFLSRKNGFKTSLASAYNRLGLVLFLEGRELDSAKYYLYKALKLRKRYARKDEVAQVLNNLALVSKVRLAYDSAVVHYQEALELLDPQSNPEIIAKVKGNLATTLSYMGEYEKSVFIFMENLAYAQASDDTVRWSSTCLDLSNTYGKLSDFESKRKYAQKACTLFITMGDEIGECKSRIALGSAYMELGNLDSASANLQKAYDLALGYEIVYLQVKALGNLAKTEYYQGNVTAAIDKNVKALSLLPLDGKGERALILLDLGVLYAELDRGDAALNSYKKAFGLVKDQMPLRELEVARQLELLYASTGQIDSAFFYGSVVRSITDTLTYQARRAFLLEKKLTAQKASHQLMLSEQRLENERIQKRRMKIYILFITILSVLIILFMWYRMRQKKKILAQQNELLGKEQELLKQEKALRQQDKAIKEKELELEKSKVDELLKNHELSSIMNVLEVQEQERRRIAQDLHDRLGSMLSMVKLHFKNTEKNLEKLHQQNRDEYDKANELLDGACDEVRKIAHNLISGVLKKFGLVAALNDLKQTVEQSRQLEMEVLTTGLDERLDWDYELNLYRIIQELLSNTMKHARAKDVSIQFVRNNGNLNVVYADDGDGFIPGKVEEGMGMKNIASRLDKLNGIMAIDSGKGGGTTFTFDIRIKDEADDKGFVS